MIARMDVVSLIHRILRDGRCAYLARRRWVGQVQMLTAPFSPALQVSISLF